MAFQVSAARRAPPRKLPKLHLIYFFLALCDLLAVAGGLFLSHRLTALFEETMAVNRAWDARLADLEKLGESAFAAGGPVNGVFVSRNPAGERIRYGIAETDFQSLANGLAVSLGAMPDGRAKETAGVIRNAQAEIAAAGRTAAQAFAAFERGDAAAAGAAKAKFDGHYTKIAAILSVAWTQVQVSKEKQLAALFARATALKRFEWLIGGFICLMVFAAVLYGSHVGRILKRSFAELESARQAADASAEQFAQLNGDISNLNRELADNLKKLGEAQDDTLRKGKLAQLGQLTATVAHEIRNPLSAVRTAAFLIQRKTKDSQLGIEPQLQRINTGVDRCDSIIGQLLDFARSKALHLESLAVDDWVAKAVQEEAERLPVAVSVACELGLGGLTSAFDPARMQRVIVNLISNASEALVGKGDDPRKFTSLVPRIEVRTVRSSRGIELIVGDNGPGIAPENLERVLEPLFTTKSFGTGLGLPAVQKILEQHGGGLEIASTQGQGARVTAWFPLAGMAEAVA